MKRRRFPLGDDKQVAATLDRFYTVSDQNKPLAQNAAAVIAAVSAASAAVPITPSASREFQST